MSNEYDDGDEGLKAIQEDVSAFMNEYLIPGIDQAVNDGKTKQIAAYVLLGTHELMLRYENPKTAFQELNSYVDTFMEDYRAKEKLRLASQH